MGVFQTCSHLNAEEYLQIRQPKLYHEIRSLISKCRTKGSTLPEWYSSVNTLKQFGASFRKLAQQLGWSETRMGFRKGKIAMKFYYPPYSTTSSFEEILGSRLMDYANGKIDVAVEIFPTEIGRITKPLNPKAPQKILGFDEAKGVVGRSGRHSPPVPLLIIGIA